MGNFRFIALFGSLNIPPPKIDIPFLFLNYSTVIIQLSFKKIKFGFPKVATDFLNYS